MASRKDILDAAVGQWPAIVNHLAAVDLSGPLATVGSSVHHLCPLHGGQHGDAFRLHPDFAETGGGVCNSCGSCADGLSLLTWLNGWDYKRETLPRVAEFLGLGQKKTTASGPATATANKKRRPAPSPSPSTPKPTGEVAAQVQTRRAKLLALWQQAAPKHPRIAEYLASRGLEQFAEPANLPSSLRLIESLAYFDSRTNQKLAAVPAIVAQINHPAQGMVALHRIYLSPNGPGKLAAEDLGIEPAEFRAMGGPKKTSRPIFARATAGGAVRLFAERKVLGVAEGIETALAVCADLATAMATTGEGADGAGAGYSIWAALTAGGLESIEIPAAVREVHIWSDHDESNRGQEAAAKLAAKLESEGRKVFVMAAEANA